MAKQTKVRADEIIDIDSGTTEGEYEAKDGQCILRVLWYAGSTDGICTITLRARQPTTIPIPANSGWCGQGFESGQLRRGVKVSFTDVASHVVFYGRAKK